MPMAGCRKPMGKYIVTGGKRKNQYRKYYKEIVSSENVYQAIAVPAWACMLAISLAYMAFCVFRGQQRWRKNMEVKLLWS